MKNTWNIRKKEDAVSPVIATILMVAITVVLAAVLYVMVIGFGGTSDTAPSGSFSSLKQTTLDTTVTPNTWSATLTFSRFNPSPPLLDLRIILTNNSDATDVVTMTMVSAPNAQTSTMTVSGATGATYTDLAFAGNEVNSGDYIIVSGLHRQTTYTVSVFHIPSSETCTLAGGTTSFSTG